MNYIFKQIIFAFFGLVIFNSALAQSATVIPKQTVPEEYGYLVKIGDQIPDFSMTLTDGKKVSPKDWKGKVVMLQFTASWCSVCRKEMPFIEKDIWLKNKNNPNFLLFGVDRDEPLEKVTKFQKDMSITYPLGLDPNADVFGLFADKKAGVTRNVILDRTGKIVYMTRLYKPEEFQEMVGVIEMLLK
ncbi:MAG: TlpA disulfide reductase family protein [Mariniphaga sp.]